ncbi:unnamed protein product [Strongylus vulgaris]|uniref:Uncharacterized protein n=1 Tax=Strongylus vulgaris TaxID=40348 RepID=A0A3P7JSE5_STRVU|nr:unnamed protein product [Strongylus vulgaris]
MPAVASISEISGATVLTVASGEASSIEDVENLLTNKPEPLHVSGKIYLANEEEVVLKDSFLRYSGNGFNINIGKTVLTIEDAKWEVRGIVFVDCLYATLPLQ